MEERTLLKISLVLMSIGLIFLFFYSSELDLDTIENYDNLHSSEPIRASGIVKQVTVKDKVTFLKLSALTEEELDVAVFNDEEIFIRTGDTVEILGQLEEYHGKKEIIASQIMVK